MIGMWLSLEVTESRLQNTIKKEIKKSSRVPVSFFRILLKYLSEVRKSGSNEIS